MRHPWKAVARLLDRNDPPRQTMQLRLANQQHEITVVLSPHHFSGQMPPASAVKHDMVEQLRDAAVSAGLLVIQCGLGVLSGGPVSQEQAESLYSDVLERTRRERDAAKAEIVRLNETVKRQEIEKAALTKALRS